MTYPAHPAGVWALYARDCDAAQTNCADVANWSDAVQVSNGLTASHLGFDTAGAAHLVRMDASDYEYDITYNTKPFGGAWSGLTYLTAQQPHDGSFAEWPAVAAGTPNNVYAAWYAWTGPDWAPVLQYSHWDGREWSRAGTPPQWSRAATYYAGPPALVVDGNNVVHVVWGLCNFVFPSSHGIRKIKLELFGCGRNLQKIRDAVAFPLPNSLVVLRFMRN